MRLLLTVAALLATPVAAQTAPTAPPAADGTAMPAMSGDAFDQRAKLMALDTDHDGKWSKAEWLAGGRKERGFTFMDADHDGFLTPDELKTGIAKLKEMRGARQQ